LFGLLAQDVHQPRHLGVARAAILTVREMLSGSGIRRLTTSVGKVAVEQAIVLQVTEAKRHGLPPSTVRSLRAARNKWTRTVDSFKPVIALTSLGVQSP